MSGSWTREAESGDTVTVSIDGVGVALSVWRVNGQRECMTLSHERFEEEYIPWLAGPFDDVIGEILEALEESRGASDDDDRRVP